MQHVKDWREDVECNSFSRLCLYVCGLLRCDVPGVERGVEWMDEGEGKLNFMRNWGANEKSTALARSLPNQQRVSTGTARLSRIRNQIRAGEPRLSNQQHPNCWRRLRNMKITDGIRPNRAILLALVSLRRCLVLLSRSSLIGFTRPAISDTQTHQFSGFPDPLSCVRNNGANLILLRFDYSLHPPKNSSLSVAWFLHSCQAFSSSLQDHVYFPSYKDSNSPPLPLSSLLHSSTIYPPLLDPYSTFSSSSPPPHVKYILINFFYNG